MLCSSYLTSTLGRKFLVGVSGLALSIFVLTHMLGNLLIFAGPEAYNLYSHKLVTNPFIYLAETGLLVLFIMHLGLATRLSILNKCARSTCYAVTPGGDKGTSLIAKTMWHQGMIILIFIVLHLITFKFGVEYTGYVQDTVVRDIYALVEEVFRDPYYVSGYLVALLVLGFHLSHGVGSAFRSIGFNHPAYDPKIQLFSKIYAIVVTVGFMSQPLYLFFT